MVLRGNGSLADGKLSVRSISALTDSEASVMAHLSPMRETESFPILLECLSALGP